MPSASAPDPFSDLAPPVRVHPGHRLWIPVAIALLAGAAWIGLELQQDQDRNLRLWGQSAVVAIALSLVLIWFLVLSRIRWWLRLLGLALLGVGVFGLSRVLVVDGTIDGRGLPRLVWKQTRPDPPETPTAARTVPQAGAAAAQAPARPVSEPLSTAADFPQFQGPLRNGVLTGLRLARDWSTTPPQELWRQPVGAGWSGFALVGRRAYTQEQAGTQERVTCRDTTDGRILWQHAHETRFFQWQGGEGPRATPTVDRGRVYAFGGTGILDCLEAETGSVVWSKPVFEELGIGNLLWGASSSPLVFGETVVVTGGDGVGPTVLAFDRQTGTLRWKSGTDEASYSSPVLGTLAGRPGIVSFNAATLTVMDPETGALRFSQAWARANWPKAAQPVLLPADRIFVTAGYGMGCELFQFHASPDGSGSLTATSVWKNLRLKAQFNSVGYRDGHLYGLDDGSLACVDAATGERLWKEGRFGSGQSLVDDLVLVQAESGDVVLAETSPAAYRELGRIKALSSKTWNHLALAGPLLVVRNDREAVAYRLPLAPQP